VFTCELCVWVRRMLVMTDCGRHGCERRPVPSLCVHVDKNHLEMHKLVLTMLCRFWRPVTWVYLIMKCALELRYIMFCSCVYSFCNLLRNFAVSQQSNLVTCVGQLIVVDTLVLLWRVVLAVVSVILMNSMTVSLINIIKHIFCWYVHFCVLLYCYGYVGIIWMVD